MTERKIISRLWGHIYDLLSAIEGKGKKSINQVNLEIDITEMYYRKYIDTDELEV